MTLKSIALIGGTGSGKSTLAKYLQDEFGAVWLDCDKTGHELLSDKTIQTLLVKEFGTSIVAEGNIDRKELGKIVFSDKSALAKLNQIMHPRIMEEIASRQREASKSGKQLCVLDGALLMDVNVKEMVDEVWAVQTEMQTRLKRLIEGRNISEDKAMQIMKNQISAEEYAAYAHRLFYLDKGIESIKEEIESALGMLEIK